MAIIAKRTLRHCIGFVYGSLLTYNLDEFTLWWNTHRMRANRKVYCPQGIPDDIYHIPRDEWYNLHFYYNLPAMTMHLVTTCIGTTNHLNYPVNLEVFSESARQYYIKVPPLCPSDFACILNVLLHDKLSMNKEDINFTNCDHVFQVLSSVLQ